jgi:intraflagellar transport protein 46
MSRRRVDVDSDDDDLGGFRGRPKSPKGRCSVDDSKEPDRSSPSVALSGEASLFALIAKFHPEAIDVPVHWKPFIPDLAPAIGVIDAFVKVPRPNGAMEHLGLVVVDEPSVAQSNPQILRMELREKYGLSSPDTWSDACLGCIEDAPKNRKMLTSWLDSLEDIHRNRPPPQVTYTSRMPELEELMQAWPDALEEVVRSTVLPGCDLDVSFEEYSRVVCSILDIPVRGRLIDSLHCFFSLYAEFEANQHFRWMAQSLSEL